MKMTLFFKLPATKDDSSLMQNDPLMVAPFFLFVVCVAYFVQRGETLLEESVRRETRVVPNKSTMNFMLRSSAFDFLGRSIPRIHEVLNFLKTIEATSAFYIFSSRSPLPEEKVLWKKKNTFKSRNGDVFLPVAFHIRATFEGADTLFYGPLKNLVVELDADTTVPTLPTPANTVPAANNNLGFRILGTGVDSNWQNKPSKEPFSFVFTQRGETLQAVVLDGTGKPDFRVKVVECILQGFPANIDEYTNVPYAIYNKNSDQCVLLANPASELLYFIRAYAKLFPSVTGLNVERNRIDFLPTAGPMRLIVAGAPHTIQKMILDGEFHSGLDLQISAETISRISIVADGITYTQKTGSDWEWPNKKVDDQISLFTASREFSGALVSSQPLKRFQSDRFDEECTLYLSEYARAQTNSRGLSFKSPELAAPPPHSRTWSMPSKNVLLLLALCMVLTIVFWARPSRTVAWFASRLAFLGTFLIFALVAVYTAVTFEAIDLPVDMVERILMVLIVAVVLCCLLSQLLCLRYEVAVSNGSYAMLVLIGGTLLLLDTASRAEGETLHKWRNTLFLVVALASSALGYETVKSGAATYLTPDTPGLRFTFNNKLFVPFICLLVVYVTAREVSELNYARDSCDRILQRLGELSSSEEELVTKTELNRRRAQEAEYCGRKDYRKFIGVAAGVFILLQYFGLPFVTWFPSEPPKYEKQGTFRALGTHFSKLYLVLVVGSVFASYRLLRDDVSLAAQDEFCTVLNERAKDAEGSWYADIVLSRDERVQEVQNAFSQNSCLRDTNVALAMVLLFLGTQAFVAFVAHERVLRLKNEANVYDALVLFKFLAGAALIYGNTADMRRNPRNTLKEIKKFLI